MKRHRLEAALTALLLLIPLLLLPNAPLAAQEPESTEIPLDRWLVLGPAPLPLPAFHGEEGVGGEPLEVADLLAMDPLDPPRVWPAQAEAVAWTGGLSLTWDAVAGPIDLAAGGDGPRVAFLATYLETDRFLEAELTVITSHLARVWLDGEQVAAKTAADPAPAEEEKGTGAKKARSGKTARGGKGGTEPSEPGTASAELTLPTGKHLLLVQALRDPAGPAPWTVAAEVSLSRELAGSLATGTSPRHGLSIADLLDVDRVTGLSVSAGGDLVALEMTHPALPSEDGESWVELRRTRDGAPVRALRGAPSISDFTWGPAERYSYVSRDEEKATLWVGDLSTGELRPLLAGVEHLGSHRWSPDGTWIVYALSEEPPEDERGAQRMRGLRDRWSGWRSRSYLYQVSLADGARRRLTAGELSTDLEDVHPDGSRILFSRAVEVAQRPFSVGELWELGVGGGSSLEPVKLGEVTWFEEARYSPDGEAILVRAGPSGFGEAGVAVPEGRIPNEYDRQLFLLHRSGEVEPLTRDFDPAVSDASWSRHDGHVYLTAADGSRVRLYRLSVEERSFVALETGVEVVEEMSLAADAPVLLFRGSSVTTPPRVLALEVDLAGTAGEPRPLLDPGGERVARVDYGRVEEWSFDAGGEQITGRIHYPPDFDPGKSWPLLVYYYGGTFPTDRSFGGRYPKNYWTANGYVVLILQPSGAVGFGQAYSSRHVNDWGQKVAEEIIRGVTVFADEHPFVDRERIGCLGASYGGFMTMLLVTRTDLFAAAISHAGISSISSYWGEGWWGFLYNAVAGAGSYPWNRRDLYVDQSPLFAADKITTPLLLVHGTADPNVPPGESEQMYTALKLLGRQVEYVKIEGEQHRVRGYEKRKLWWQTLLAWFDKHLKGQPEWWDHLWKGKG